MVEAETLGRNAPAEESSSQKARCHSLEQRLTDGYARIDEALISGADVAQWESFWVKLLREYEDVCRELDVAA